MAEGWECRGSAESLPRKSVGKALLLAVTVVGVIGRVSELVRSLTPLLLALVALCGAPAPGHAIAGVESCASARRNESLFNGRPCDRFSQMINYRSRWYEPAHGRFVSTDPIGAFGDPVNLGNAYTYVGNNPGAHAAPYRSNAPPCRCARDRVKPTRLIPGNRAWKSVVLRGVHCARVHARQNRRGIG